MKTIDVVIGSNFGDEGKGIITARIANRSNHTNILNVLTNGGSQRGHTVNDGTRQHTFKHFGSATFNHATSYCSQDFILNPMQFVKEYLELNEIGIYAPVMVHPLCRISTPFDMMANQIFEMLQWKGSCGMGIWETVLRYSLGFSKIYAQDLYLNIDLRHELNKIKQYYEMKFNKYSVDIPSCFSDAWDSNGTIEHYISDCHFMKNHITICENPSKLFSHFIFESGQGLLLKDNGTNDSNTTPSDTGATAAAKIITQWGLDTQQSTLHYVTRPYLTRHGGTNLNVKERTYISSSIKEDRTNGYNDFQRDFLYGQLNIEDLKNRIAMDSNNISNHINIEVTHCDEMDRSREFINQFNCYEVNFYDSYKI